MEMAFDVGCTFFRADSLIGNKKNFGMKILVQNGKKFLGCFGSYCYHVIQPRLNILTYSKYL